MPAKGAAVFNGSQDSLPTSDLDGLIHGVVGLVYVHQGAVAQAPGMRHVFYVGHALVGGVEQFVGLGEAVLRRQVAVDEEAVVEVLAVVEVGCLHLVNGGVSLTVGSWRSRVSSACTGSHAQTSFRMWRAARRSLSAWR